MKNGGMRKVAMVVAAGITLAGTFAAGVAYAGTYDPNLDDADAACVKAIAFLQAASNPGVKPPFDDHRDKAITALGNARDQIAKAEKYATQHPPKTPPPPH